MLADPRERSWTRTRLDRAWERFVAAGALDGVRPEIARSWTRAREVYRIDPSLRRAPLGSRDEVVRRCEDDETFEVARPVLSVFSERLRDRGHVLSFFDVDGVMLSIGGDPATIARVAEINLSPGSSWREDVAGTNGAGTALLEREPTEVFASEHFVAAWQPWTTAAAPIFAPGTREPLGLVQLAGPWDAPDPQGLVAAAAIAAVVEERLRGRVLLRDELVRYALRTARHSGDALVALDVRGRMLQANDAARRRLAIEADVPVAVRERIAALLRDRDAPPEQELSLEWPGAGEERRRIVCSIVSHDGRAVGAILRLAPPADARIARGAAAVRQRLTTRYALDEIVGQSERLRGATDLAQVAARNDLPVVLHGESGTGKELFAHGIHAASARAGAPFVAVNCGAIPAPLIEAELFGYEPGTFTGAQREGKAGKLEEAHGGTLFLDEVSELPMQAQTALLRVLQESEVVRLGGSAPRRVDVRVLAATNRRLYDQVKVGRFRQDLYFRLNVLHVDIPPLRDRIDDVPVLARAFLAEAEERIGREGLELSPEALAVLTAYPWPGNVRELKNVILRAAAVVVTRRIEPRDLKLIELRSPAERLASRPPSPLAPGDGAGAGAQDQAGADGEGPERDELVAALDAGGWNIARTATSLGVSRMTLYRRLRKFGITR